MVFDTSKIIDFHAHAFSDALAPKAMKALSAGCPDIPYYLDGTVSALLGSMDDAGIEKTVICSIATRPKQFEPILEWSLQIQSDRLIPLASIHPDDPDKIEHIKQIKEAGLVGIKMHPYYQDFYLDEEKMFDFYQKVCDENLLLVSHTGFDVAFPFVKRAEPQRILNVLERFPKLKLISTHLGAWQDWDEVERLMLGKRIYMEISFALGYLPNEKAKKLLDGHPADYILFGTDSPWGSQKQTVNWLENLQLSAEKEKKILYSNASALLGF